MDANNECTQWINDFKLSMSRAMTRNEKIILLTTVPVKWSIRKISKEFNVSRRMVSLAKKLQEEKGYCSQPEKKKRSNNEFGSNQNSQGILSFR